LTNPCFGDLDVPATTMPLQLQVPFVGTAITPVSALTFESGSRYLVYAIGSVAGGTFDTGIVGSCLWRPHRRCTPGAGD
jgi:hypothetical protein